MARAVAKVEQKIIITGADNASAAVKSAQASLAGLRKEAGKVKTAAKSTSATPIVDPAKIQQGTQRSGAALAGLTAALGSTQGALGDAGRAATALGSTAAVLPGPIGLAAAAVTGLAAGVYLLGNAALETAAQLELLGTADTARLKRDLDLSTDGAIKLSRALADLNDKGLRPSDDLLQQVIKNANRMGKDGTAAAVAFVKALEAGPEALAKFQGEFGRINGAIASLPDLAASLGLSAEKLGLSKAITVDAEKQAEVARGLNRIQVQQLELVKTQRAEVAARGVIDRTNSRFQQLVAETDLRAAERKSAALRSQIESERALLVLIQQEAAASDRAAAARSIIAARADVLEAQAAATRDKGNASRLRGEALAARQLVAVKALNAFDRLHGTILSANLTTERASLQVRVLQAKAAADAVREANRQSRVASAQRARAASAAVRAAHLKTETARADRDGLRTERERFALLERQRVNELAATAAIPNAAARAAARLAIEEDYATKRAAVERQIQAEIAKTNAQTVKLLEDDSKRRVEIAEKRLAVKKALADAERKIDEQLRALDIETIDRSAAALSGVAQSMTSAGQALGSISGQAVGQGLSVAVKASADLAKNLNDVPKAAEGVATALGQIGAVAVDAETSRTTKQLEAEKQRELATATTEEQRARITQNFEDRKAAAVEAGEKRKAAILGVMELAAVAASFPNIPLMASHGLAAGIYGGIAGGLIGGSSGSAPTVGAGGGGFSTPLAGPSTAPDAGGGQNVTINFNQPLSTKQDIGKAVQSSLRSLKTTGHATAKGA